MKRIVTVVAVLLLAVLLRPAWADNVSRLIDDLGSDDYKERVSAVASLAKLGDSRAIDPLAQALAGDDEKSVRQAAAVALGKLVNSETDEDLIDEAQDALATAAKKDSASSVKKAAKKALAKVKKIVAAGAGGSGGGGSGGIYVNIGEMSATIDDGADEMQALMRKTVAKQFSKKAPDIKTGDAPSKKELKNLSAFYVDGTLNTLSTKEKGSDVIVTCKVHMLIATYPAKSLFGFLDGKASVQASNEESDIEGAKSDCVSAVVEDLTMNKIIPTIKAKAGS